MTTFTNPNPADEAKTARLRAAYDDFTRKMQELKEERLQFLKKTFRKLDEEKIAKLREELK